MRHRIHEGETDTKKAKQDPDDPFTEGDVEAGQYAVSCAGRDGELRASVGKTQYHYRPVSLECRVARQIPLGSHDLFLADIVGVSVDGRYLDKNGRFCLNRCGLAAYSHGEYFALGERLGSFGYSVRKDGKPRK